MGENKFHTQMGISKIGEKGYSKNLVSWNHSFQKKISFNTFNNLFLTQSNNSLFEMSTFKPKLLK